ncbi:MAG: phage tail protein [Nitrospirota bacterium]|nr:phage tail protein [Nitrospirota bacterium]
MIELNVTADIRRTERWLTGLKKKAVSKAASMAINRVAGTVRSRGVKAIAGITSLKQKRVRDVVVIAVKARRSNLTAVIRARPHGINLIEFVAGAKRVPGAFRRQAGVSAKAWGQRKVYKGTFIGRGPRSGKLIVAARTGKARGPLRGISGPSIPRTFLREEVQREMLTAAKARWPIEFERALRVALRSAS